MRIRCERCQAEYPLDDSQLHGGRTDVQCSVCGNVFTVAPPAEASHAAPGGSPEDAGWFLQTADRQVRRFRGLMSLHKWIIERRVTRRDRVSRDGHTWQTVGEIAELAPYLDAAEQGERVPRTPPARVASGSGRRTPTRSRSPSAGARSASHDARGNEPFVPAASVPTGRFPAQQSSHGALKIFIGLTVAAGVAFSGIRWQESRTQNRSVAIATLVPKLAGALASSGAARQPAVNPVERQPSPASEAAPALAAAPSAPSTRGPVVEALPSPEPAKAASEPDKRARPAPGPAPADSYEKLVAEGDRSLENGLNGKAKDLYQKALGLRPGGAKALTGLGFVALDRGQLAPAYQYFKRALAAKGSFPPAFFGMAEVHRARGEKALALQNYQHYLKASPNGSDAAAARRKVQSLQGAP